MTRRILHIAFLLLALSAIGLKAQQNPILPGFHADPEVLYSHLTHRYYIYSTTPLPTVHLTGVATHTDATRRPTSRSGVMRVMCLTHVTDRFTKKNAVRCDSERSTLP